ncbi:MAG: putative maltokinase, partial [Chloroflexi bacterium]|nr:putative maltokinase [Chloroflexota bacterium]
PGTPVIYYGDEIGMGDNFFLGDRNGVRTPMQWTVDRNAGFSRANSQQLYLPVITDPEYHYETINVEVQDRNPDSLLWWMRRTIALRKAHKAFSRGSIELIRPSNYKVLAFIRRHEDETVVVVANLSRHAQYAQFELPQLKGSVPRELFGGARFPAIHDARFSVMLAPYGFYWFAMEARPAEARLGRRVSAMERPPLALASTRAWEELFDEDPPDSLVSMLVEHMKESRWFGGKARDIQTTSVVDAIPFSVGDAPVHLVMLKVDYAEGEPETYNIPIALALGEQAQEIVRDHPAALIGRARIVGGKNVIDGVVYDAVHDRKFGVGLLGAIARYRHVTSPRGGWLSGASTRLFGLQRVGLEPDSPVKLGGAEQSNTSLIYGNRFILKLYRKLGEGTNPDLEIGRFLLEKTRFRNVANLCGSIEYMPRRRAEPVTLALLNVFVENAGDAWAYTTDELVRYYERVMAHPETKPPPLPAKPLAEFSREQPSNDVIELIGPYLVSARLLGQRTGELHAALASRFDDPAFAPEPFTQLYQRSIFQGVRNSVTSSLRRLREALPGVPAEVQQDIKAIVDSEARIVEHIASLTRMRISAMRIRVHGDYHLGQVLYTGRDFVIIDFEGEPARPLSERRLKRSSLADVGGMVRSFHYAAFHTLHQRTAKSVRTEQIPVLESWARHWYTWVAAAFLDGYLKALSGSPIVPVDPQHVQALLNANLIAKALYEVWYEFNNRPEWVRIPLRGVQEIIGSPA